MGAIDRGRCRVIHDDGRSRLGGCDAGRYPVRRFFSLDEADGGALPLRVAVCGEDEWGRGCCRFRDNSSVFAVELITAGVLAYDVNGRRHEAGPGDLLVVHLGDDYEMYVPRGEFMRKKIVLLGGFLAASLSGFGEFGRTALIRSARRAELEAVMDAIIAEYAGRSPGFAERGSRLAYQLLQELAAEVSRPACPPELAAVVRYLEENYRLSLSVDELCAKFGFSPATLYRQFKRHLATSPTEYRIARRMAAARELLGYTDLPVKEVARRCGYDHPLYFSGEFRRCCGVSPREYRRTSSVRL